MSASITVTGTVPRAGGNTDTDLCPDALAVAICLALAPPLLQLVC